ncbi:flagellin [Methylobacterium sp. J-043]|uniref:flagellin N-terminal helical domain-containing protein n=1 Tax=Methylorubrum TaxID=2282523 RepID=UPI00209F8AD6|nr:flagellin [Methylobacterium sp. J-043]MCP1551361.1 flagellin [Methylorubrum zatmanii]MCP1552023.1 flagellin [Methylorubrum extorquens]MCP1581666.1 flagellin [Methylorubrum extorquens]
MTSLLTNISAMTALTTLKGINSQLDATSNRVSTGQRVSTAADNAAYWSIATTVRTDNASLSAVKDSLGLGSSAVDTAYNGLNSILSDMQNLRAKLQTALQPGVDRSKVQTEIAAIQSKMKATADSSNSSGQNWLSVDSTATNTAYQATQSVIAGFSRAGGGAVTFSKINVDVNAIKLYDVNASSVTTAATSGQVFAQTSLTGTAAFRPGDAVVANRGTANFNGANEVAFTLSLGDGSTADIVINSATMASAARDLTRVTTDEFLAAINNQITADTATTPLSGKVAASLDASGRLTFTSTATGSGTDAQISVKNINASGTNALVDVGFSAISATPTVKAGTNFTTVDLTADKVITVNDGNRATTVTLTAALYGGLASPTSTGSGAVNGSDTARLINAQLTAAGNTARIAFGADNKLTLTSSSTLPITVGGADVTSFGFTAGQTAPVSAASTGSGTAAGTTAGKGILDTADATTGFSISSINISNLTGTAGDTALQNIITQVEKALAKVTDAGTKLGANKTQIDGQKTFVDTLMKANDRTVGILVDADIEEESTKLKALQTQQQLAVQALSIANSGSQNVLSLFR